VQQYTDQYYMPNFARMVDLTSPDLKKGLEYAAWRASLEQTWGQVQVRDVQVANHEVQVGKHLEVTAAIQLGALKPSDVRVQVYYGGLNTRGEIETGEAVDMKPLNNSSDGIHTFGAQLTYNNSGERGISVRVLPNHPSLPTPFQPGIIRWAK
jgi:glycogen phosphorylase